MMQLSRFDESARLQELSRLGDTLEKFNQVIEYHAIFILSFLIVSYIASDTVKFITFTVQ
jgi:hypothetical protein